MLTLVGVGAWALAPTGDVDPARLALVIASLVVVGVAFRVWGAQSAWSWVVAALVYEALGGLRAAVYGPEWQARGAGALTVLGATVLIVLIMRRALGRPVSW